MIKRHSAEIKKRSQNILNGQDGSYLLKSSSRMPEKMNECLVNGSIGGYGPVVFRCRYGRREVSVEMVSPYAGECEGPRMTFSTLERSGGEDGYPGWQETAWGLVRGILEREEWKANHRGVYEKRLEECRRTQKEIRCEIERLKDRLVELHRTRKGGMWGALLYGQQVQSVQRERSPSGRLWP